jgi:ABC1 atypical kinase-like domain
MRMTSADKPRRLVQFAIYYSIILSIIHYTNSLCNTKGSLRLPVTNARRALYLKASSGGIDSALLTTSEGSNAIRSSIVTSTSNFISRIATFGGDFKSQISILVEKNREIVLQNPALCAVMAYKWTKPIAAVIGGLIVLVLTTNAIRKLLSFRKSARVYASQLSMPLTAPIVAPMVAPGPLFVDFRGGNLSEPPQTHAQTSLDTQTLALLTQTQPQTHSQPDTHTNAHTNMHEHTRTQTPLHAHDTSDVQLKSNVAVIPSGDLGRGQGAGEGNDKDVKKKDQAMVVAVSPKPTTAAAAATATATLPATTITTKSADQPARSATAPVAKAEAKAAIDAKDSVEKPVPLGPYGDPSVRNEYNPTLAADYFSRKRAVVYKRGTEIGSALTLFGAALMVDYLSGRIWSYQQQKIRAAHLTAMLSSLGPAFIKVGQILSIRTDLLPMAYTEELCKLQDCVAPFSTEEARAIIRKELGRSADVIFSSGLEPDAEVVASASLGQVYKAKLRSDGTEVMVTYVDIFGTYAYFETVIVTNMVLIARYTVFMAPLVINQFPSS